MGLVKTQVLAFPGECVSGKFLARLVLLGWATRGKLGVDTAKAEGGVGRQPEEHPRETEAARRGKE